MKYISFSFDDGRLDTYTNAARIMDRYNIKATINIVSDFVENSSSYSCFITSGNRAMTAEMVVDLDKRGYEIACHGHTHKNSAKDVTDNIEHIKSYGINTSGIGFASPFSYITDENCTEIKKLKEKKILSYIRTGIQTRRENILYKVKSLLMNYIPLTDAFISNNINNCFNINNVPELITGISVTSKTSNKQIERFIDKMPENCAAILIFHSVLEKQDENYAKDKWYWDADRFDELCRCCAENPNVSVLTTRKICGIKQ